MKRSMRRASFGDMYGARSKFFTSPAIWLDRRDGSKRVMRVMPDFPARAFAHASATPLPMGQTMPRPVTTTRRRFQFSNLMGSSGPSEGPDVVRRLLVGREPLRLLLPHLAVGSCLA